MLGGLSSLYTYFVVNGDDSNRGYSCCRFAEFSKQLTVSLPKALEAPFGANGLLMLLLSFSSHLVPVFRGV